MRNVMSVHNFTMIYESNTRRVDKKNYYGGVFMSTQSRGY